jgi:hypothetical protein
MFSTSVFSSSVVVAHGEVYVLRRCVVYLEVAKDTTGLIVHCFYVVVAALFAPPATKWYQLLNRIRFPSPTKAVIYRVRPLSDLSLHLPPINDCAGLARPSHNGSKLNAIFRPPTLTFSSLLLTQLLLPTFLDL